MSAEGEVVWKCGACNECFYDLQILATHKCMGNDGTLAISESCIKQLEAQAFDDADLNDSSDTQDITELNINTDEIAAIQYSNSSIYKIQKPTIVSVGTKREVKFRQKGKRSIVWTYFTALDDKKASCCICHRVISYCGTPTNLVYHLSRYHPNESNIVKSKQANNVKYQYLSAKLPKFNFPTPKNNPKKQQQCKTVSIVPQGGEQSPSNLQIVTKKPNTTEKIVEMLLVDMLPVTMVEGEGFKNFVMSLDPSYKMPGAKEFFINYIPKMYYTEYKRVQKVLREAEYVHVSVELWKGHDDMDFLTISTHLVSNDFQYTQFVLSTHCLSDLSSDSIMTHVVSTISQWDLSMGVFSIVHDGTHFMSKVAKSTGWTEIICFAHILDDIIKTAIHSSEELMQVIAKCRSIISFLRSNDTAKQQLMEAQMHEKNQKMQHFESDSVDINAGVDKKYPLQVKKDSPDEWISTFYMLQRISTLKNVLIKILSNFSLHVNSLTKKDWTMIEETVSLLKAFEMVTLELSNEPHQYASKVIPVTLGLNSLIHNCSTLSQASTKGLRKQILNALKTRLGDVEDNLTLAMATVLDPRFKSIAFQSEEAVEAVVQQLSEEAAVEVVESPAVEVSAATDGLWAGFEKKACPKKTALKKDHIVSTEIKNYLGDPLLDRKKDPFLWWGLVGKGQYPILAKMVKKYLCIPATSVPSERVFHKRGKMFSEKRKLIKQKYVDQFVFLNRNIQ